MTTAPPVDRRTSAQLLEEIQDLAAFYAPEWAAGATQGPGAALQQIFARMFEGLLLRLNQVPRRQFIAFLNMLGVKLLPALPARAPVTFILSKGASDAVTVPARAQVAAKPQDGGDPLVFETEKAFLATPAKLQGIVTVNPHSDAVYDHSEAFGGSAVELFAGVNAQEHALYLAHSRLFDIKGTGQLTLSLQGPRSGLSAQDFTRRLSWEWWDGSRWVPSSIDAFYEAVDDFPASTTLATPLSAAATQATVTMDVGSDERFPDSGLLLIGKEIVRYTAKDGDRFLGLSRGVGHGQVPGATSAAAHGAGATVRAIAMPLLVAVPTVMPLSQGRERVTVELTKTFDAPLGELEVHGIKNIWLRCRTLRGERLASSPLRHLLIDTLQIGAAAEGLPPDALYHNDVPLDPPSTGVPIYPFGPRPRTLDAFYIASSDAFSKAGAPVTITIGATQAGVGAVSVRQVQGIGPTFSARLEAAGIRTADELLERTSEEIAAVLGTSRTRALNILEAAQKAFYDKTGIFKPLAEAEQPPPGEELSLSWEYWDGTGWKGIPGRQDTTDKLRRAGTVRFTCPDDMAETTVAGEAGLWIRARIVSGDYGREQFSFDGTNVISDTSQIHPPIVDQLAISYEPELAALEACLTSNSLDYEDYTEEAEASQQTFRPFVAPADEHQTLYLGFDQPPTRGPISLFVSLEEQPYSEDALPRLEWEYLRGPTETWTRLEVSDGTMHLTESGTIEFIGPTDFATTTRFGRRGAWIRAVDVNDAFQPTTAATSPVAEAASTEVPPSTVDCGPAPCPELLSVFHPVFSQAADGRLTPAPLVRGFHLNTTWATQAETVRDEILGSGSALAAQSFTATRAPVMDEELWIDELGTLSEGEREEILAQGDLRIDEVKDAKGNPIRFWVLWQAAEDLSAAGSADRVYAIDRALGLITSGDGVHGRVPPIGRDNVRITYRTGGGSRGNVGVGTIKALRTTIPFVSKASNPEAAGGGSDVEAVDQALLRGPQMLRHRGRAVTAEDYEWLAREASREVARVRCLPTFNDQGQYETNWVTVIIVPASGDVRPMPSPRLRDRVEQYLRQRAPNVTTFPRHVQVTGPTYVEVTVSADLYPLTMDLAPTMEAAAYQALEAFLHPLTGGSDGLGWAFGRLPCLSDFYGLLEAVEGLDHVERLSFTLQAVTPYGVAVGAPVRVDEEHRIDERMPEYALIFSGPHELTVKAPR